MGLSIYYESLDDFLIQWFSDEKDIRTRADQAKKILKSAIKEQTGESPEFPPEVIPSGLEGFKFGNYTEIHFLRMFAARISGYTLDEAYNLPDIEIDFLENGEKVIDGEEEYEDEESAEADFQDIWDVPIDEVLPKSSSKRSPFPYYNLVCFSDSEGIYIPVKFNRPIILEGANIGSNIRLFEELDVIGKELTIALNNALNRQNRTLEEYLLYVRQLWWRLHDPCEQSVKSKISFVFC
jgi:hypothetical protein